ncbi:terpenoid synthase-like protein [Phanerochaete sordida]|uniref:Terpenoid synthase-like protein n=1 Tax=Phanerochaete sordida TaxID=48140 RepID=A0A9P3GPT4_9APHY|nr:terpenoid synthase-like protein [Phanerochaete sordida]
MTIDNFALLSASSSVTIQASAKHMSCQQNESRDIPDNDPVLALSRHAVSEFLRRTGLPVPALDTVPDDTVAERIRATVASWDFGGISPERVARHTVTSIRMATTTFAHNHADTQVHIALYTVLALCVDDLEVDSSALAEFVGRLQAGQPQLHPVLGHLAENVRAMPGFFHPYAASAILVGTLHHVNCTLFEAQADAAPLHPAALPYVLYKRARNSLGEVYSAFVWDRFSFPDISSHIQVTPETMVYLDYANDILSFYKEEMAGERHNFVHDRARVTGKDVSSVLDDILDEVVGAVDRARGILQGEKEKETWERFLAGYVAFHFLSPRYKLAQLTA